MRRALCALLIIGFLLALSCADDDVPDGRPKIFYGGVRLASQQAIDEFGKQEYELVTGSVTVTSRHCIDSQDCYNTNDIVSLKPLQHLRTKAGNLFLEYLTHLTTLDGLQGLDSIGGDLDINMAPITSFAELRDLKYVRFTVDGCNCVDFS